jgi:hypothetical protein
LESIKELYATCFDFKYAYENCREGRTWNNYVMNDGFLYRTNKLCVPASFVRLLFLQEAHGGGFCGTFQSEENWGCADRSLLLTKNDARRGALGVMVHYLQQS